MVLDQDRADNWLTKGLGGAIDMIEQRSRSNRFVDRNHYNDLQESLRNLEQVASSQVSRGTEDFDSTVSTAVSLLTQLFVVRCFRSGLRGMDATMRDSIGGYARRLRESLDRFSPTTVGGRDVATP